MPPGFIGRPPLWSPRGRRTPLRGESGAQRQQSLTERRQHHTDGFSCEVCSSDGERYLTNSPGHLPIPSDVLDHDRNRGVRQVRPEAHMELSYSHTRHTPRSFTDTPGGISLACSEAPLRCRALLLT